MPSFLLVHRQVSLGQNHKTAGQVAATGSKVLKIHILHKIEKQAYVSSTCVHVLFYAHTPSIRKHLHSVLEHTHSEQLRQLSINKSNTGINSAFLEYLAVNTAGQRINKFRTAAENLNNGRLHVA